MCGGQKGDGSGAGNRGARTRSGAGPLRRRSSGQQTARRWLISGRVQGVGFRAFVETEARAIGVAGWVRNLDDGRVEAYAVGTPEQLDALAGRLHQGPLMAVVRGLEQQEAEMQQLGSFHTK